MSTGKHDEIMARTVSVTVSDLADLAREANALQADVVGQADAVRYLRDSLRSSNDARAVLVDELHKLDDELRSERSAFGVMEQTALTLRDQLAIETAKHARATRHIALMATGQGWLPGKGSVHVGGQHMSEQAHQAATFPWHELAEARSTERDRAIAELQAFREQHDPIVQALQAELDKARAELAPHLDETEPEPADEPRPFKIGDRVERTDYKTFGGRSGVTGQRGIVVDDDNMGTAPYWVVWDEQGGVLYPDGDQRGEPCDTDELRRIEWEAGERIEVGTEVEYVGPDRMLRGSRGVIQGVRTVAANGRPSVASATTIPGSGSIVGTFLHNLRRIS